MIQTIVDGKKKRVVTVKAVIEVESGHFDYDGFIELDEEEIAQTQSHPSETVRDHAVRLTAHNTILSMYPRAKGVTIKTLQD